MILLYKLLFSIDNKYHTRLNIIFCCMYIGARYIFPSRYHFSQMSSTNKFTYTGCIDIYFYLIDTGEQLNIIRLHIQRK